jgi:hypothetical protein
MTSVIPIDRSDRCRGRLNTASVRPSYYARALAQGTPNGPARRDRRTYRGDRVTFGVVSSTATGVGKRTARRYPVGSEVDVHYDPMMPSESVLRPFAWWHLIFLVAAGAVLWLAWAGGRGRR